MAIIAGLADIFTENLGMTPTEMILLEAFLLDATDLALYVGNSPMALDFEDALLDLHALKLSYLTRGGVLKFWDVTFPDQALTFAWRACLASLLPKRRFEALSKKHNTKHPDRSVSRYPARLAARNATSASVRMESLTVLRKRQQQRIDLTGVPWPTARSDDELLAA